MTVCPCRALDNSTTTYEQCCAPLHTGRSAASTPEALMRARYSAYAKRQIAFIAQTQLTEKAEEFDEAEAEKWAESAEWRGLKIVETRKGSPQDDEGIVVFEAHYTDKSSGKELIHRETSLFKRHQGAWMFKEGVIAGAQAYKRLEPKIGRNDPCICGSGKKYKKCCGV